MRFYGWVIMIHGLPFRNGRKTPEFHDTRREARARIKAKREAYHRENSIQEYVWASAKAVRVSMDVSRA